MITGDHNDCLIVDFEFVELGHQATNPMVNALDHCRVRWIILHDKILARALRLVVRWGRWLTLEFVDVACGGVGLGFQRSVDGVMG